MEPDARERIHNPLRRGVSAMFGFGSVGALAIYYPNLWLHLPHAMVIHLAKFLKFGGILKSA
jgi:hypothetical protein